MPLQEEVIKLLEKNKRLVPNNSNSSKIFVQVAQMTENSVNIDNGENSTVNVVSDADIKVLMGYILQHSTSNTSFVLQHPTPEPEGTPSTKPTKSKGLRGHKKPISSANATSKRLKVINKVTVERKKSIAQPPF